MLHHALRGIQKSTTAASVTYNTSASDTTNATSYTFTSQSIGTATNRNLVVVIVHTNNTSADVTAMTIGGTSATKAANAGITQHVGIWYLSGVSGTTASIVITTGASSNNCVISVYSLYNLNSNTPTVANSVVVGNTVNTTNTSVTANGVLVTGITGSTNSTTTWTNATENYDTVVESTVRSGASTTISTTNASYATTATITVSGNFTQVAAAWR